MCAARDVKGLYRKAYAGEIFSTHYASNLGSALQAVVNHDVGPKGWPKGTTVVMKTLKYAR